MRETILSLKTVVGNSSCTTLCPKKGYRHAECHRVLGSFISLRRFCRYVTNQEEEKEGFQKQKGKEKDKPQHAIMSARWKQF